MPALRNISIKKLYALLSIQVVVALMAFGVLWSLKLGTDQALLSAYETRYQSYLLADELRQSSDDLTRLARTYVVTGDDKYERQYMDILAIRNGQKPRPVDAHRIYWDFVAATGKPPRASGDAVPLAELMKRAGFTREEFEKLKEAEANSNGLVSLEVRAMNAVKGRFADKNGNYNVAGAPDPSLARALMHSDEYHRFKADIMGPVDQFFGLLEARTQGEVDAAAADIRFFQWLMVGMAAAVVIALLLTGFVLMTRIVRPITRLGVSMTALAEGDREIGIPFVERGDEIGGMARTVSVFKSSMVENERLQAEQAAAEKRALEEEHRRAEEKRVAEENAEKERRAAEEKAAADRRAAMLKLADEFESSIGGIIRTLSGAAREMEVSAQAMSSTAEQTSQQSASAASATEQASASVRSVAGAAEELTATVQEVGRQIEESARIARSAVSEVEDTNVRIQGLADAASRIGDVVSLITDIASQTNLLALNATIEAARAGDAGKGFAVVASEVKSLANQTARATEEIAGQIGDIQTATEEAVGAIEHISTTIGDISEIATGIASAVEEQSAAINEIARNAQQAAHGTQTVSGEISSVSEAAEQAGSAAGEVLSAAGDVAGKAGALQQAVQKFLTEIRAA